MDVVGYFVIRVRVVVRRMRIWNFSVFYFGIFCVVVVVVVIGIRLRLRFYSVESLTGCSVFFIVSFREFSDI